MYYWCCTILKLILHAQVALRNLRGNNCVQAAPVLQELNLVLLHFFSTFLNLILSGTVQYWVLYHEVMYYRYGTSTNYRYCTTGTVA